GGAIAAVASPPHDHVLALTALDLGFEPVFGRAGALLRRHRLEAILLALVLRRVLGRGGGERARALAVRHLFLQQRVVTVERDLERREVLRRDRLILV